MTKVELFELIRQEHFQHGKSIRNLSEEYTIHRRMVRQAIKNAIPPARKSSERVSPVLTAQIRGVIDAWMIADRAVRRKQRHTARRIFQRLQDEYAFQGSEVTVRRYVRSCRWAVGFATEAFVPQIHLPGEEAEVDWYEADVIFPRGQETVQFFAMRACSSGDEYHRAFPRQTQQAFMEGHVTAFSNFGGVFRKVRYDNLTLAVKKILKGRRRQEADRFVALRSHYLFESIFCRPGLEGAHEKGGVENTVGRFRRSHLVPVPAVRDYAELNAYLVSCCRKDRERRIHGRPCTVGESWAEEARQLPALPSVPFSTAEVGSGGVDAKGLVAVRTNRYSVPIGLAQRSVEVKVHANQVEFVHGGRVVACHERLTGRFGIRVVLDHYLELLAKKPGAFRGSLALWQARESGSWPPLYDRLWENLKERFGEFDGTRELVEVLLLHRTASPAAVTRAVTEALSFGCCDAGVVAIFLRRATGHPSAPPPLLSDLGLLDAYHRPAGDVRHYDVLLTSLASAGVL